MRSLLLVLLLSACGASAPRTTTASASSPSSLDEALAANGLTRAPLVEVARERSGISQETRVDGNRVVTLETAGFSSAPTVFARRADGTVVIVLDRPRVVVDRHVPGNCRPFSGGRGWFDAVTYQLPEGASYGGTVTVEYDYHTEVVDYSGVAADGTECPPPMQD